jgi:hypothetical protein
MRQLLVAIVVLGLVGCTDPDPSSPPLGDKAGEVSCYSGGLSIYSGKSAGKINVDQAGGYEFTEQDSGRIIRTNADCVIKY